jgi:30S ribosomal protein S31
MSPKRRRLQAQPRSYNRSLIDCLFWSKGMGKGDKRTRRGKIYKGSYGKKRPQRSKKKGG